MKKAVDELKSFLMKRIQNPELISTDSIEKLVETINTVYRCKLTNEEITKAIRRAEYDIERGFMEQKSANDDVLVLQLEMLDSLLTHFDRRKKRSLSRVLEKEAP